MLINDLLNIEPSHGAAEVMANWSDDALIHCVIHQHGQSDHAFATLMSRYHPWIFRRCLFRLGNHHDAEDATQDVVIRLQAKLYQFEGRAQFKGWLNAIITNYCNTYVKRQSRYVNCDQFEQLVESQEHEVSTDPYAVLAEQQLLQQALGSLSDKSRQVLKLRFFADRSLEEIARILSISLSATKARLYRAIEQLTKLFYRLDGNDLPQCLT